MLISYWELSKSANCSHVRRKLKIFQFTILQNVSIIFVCDCKEDYIGESLRPLHHRIHEHGQLCRGGDVFLHKTHSKEYKQSLAIVKRNNSYKTGITSILNLHKKIDYYPMCFSFWGVPRGDSRLTNQSATWLVYLRGVSISSGKTPKAKTHSVHF